MAREASGSASDVDIWNIPGLRSHLGLSGSTTTIGNSTFTSPGAAPSFFNKQQIRDIVAPSGATAEGKVFTGHVEILHAGELIRALDAFGAKGSELSGWMRGGAMSAGDLSNIKRYMSLASGLPGMANTQRRLFQNGTGDWSLQEFDKKKKVWQDADPSRVGMRPGSLRFNMSNVADATGGQSIVGFGMNKNGTLSGEISDLGAFKYGERDAVSMSKKEAKEEWRRIEEGGAESYASPQQTDHQNNQRAADEKSRANRAERDGTRQYLATQRLIAELGKNSAALGIASSVSSKGYSGYSAGKAFGPWGAGVGAAIGIASGIFDIIKDTLNTRQAGREAVGGVIQNWQEAKGDEKAIAQLVGMNDATTAQLSRLGEAILGKGGGVQAVQLGANLKQSFDDPYTKAKVMETLAKFGKNVSIGASHDELLTAVASLSRMTIQNPNELVNGRPLSSFVKELGSIVGGGGSAAVKVLSGYGQMTENDLRKSKELDRDARAAYSLTSAKSWGTRSYIDANNREETDTIDYKASKKLISKYNRVGYRKLDESEKEQFALLYNGGYLKSSWSIFGNRSVRELNRDRLKRANLVKAMMTGNLSQVDAVKLYGAKGSFNTSKDQNLLKEEDYLERLSKGVSANSGRIGDFSNLDRKGYRAMASAIRKSVDPLLTKNRYGIRKGALYDVITGNDAGFRATNEIRRVYREQTGKDLTDQQFAILHATMSREAAIGTDFGENASIETMVSKTLRRHGDFTGTFMENAKKGDGVVGKMYGSSSSAEDAANSGMNAERTRNAQGEWKFESLGGAEAVGSVDENKHIEIDLKVSVTDGMSGKDLERAVSEAVVNRATEVFTKELPGVVSDSTPRGGRTK